MSDPKKETRNESQETKGSAKDKQEEAASTEPKRYVFKIMPADPKNNLDFEDMADK